MAWSNGCDDIQDLAASLPTWLLGESGAHVKVSGYG